MLFRGVSSPLTAALPFRRCCFCASRSNDRTGPPRGRTIHLAMTLDIGCGKKKQEPRAVGVDREPGSAADVLAEHVGGGTRLAVNPNRPGLLLLLPASDV